MASVFFSYSHKDEALRDRLETSLAMLKRQGFVETWHDRRIVAGDDLTGAIAAELERADVVLLLVSPDFLASAYCYDREMQRAMERHAAGTARVIPIILRPCQWQDAPFSHLLAVPKDGLPVTKHADLDDAFLDIANAIKKACKSRVSPGAIPPVATSTPTVDGPRSSNLRTRRAFSAAEQDAFVEDAFAFMATFFERSMTELQRRNPDVETRFRRIDANTFTAVAYRDGNSVARCRIYLAPATTGGGIAFSYDEKGEGISFNEHLCVVADERGIALRAVLSRSRADQHLTFEGAAENYWARFMEPLQR